MSGVARIPAALLLLLLLAPGLQAATPTATTSVESDSLPLPAPGPLIRRYGIVPYRAGGSYSAPQSSSITPTCSSPQLSYFNGPVVSNVQIVPVLWGTHVNSQTATNISRFYSDATLSNWYDMLSEYASVGGTNQSIGRGNAVSAITITPSICSSSSNCTLTDAQLQTELASQINSGMLPQPLHDSAGHTNTAYMVHFPSNVSLQAPDGTSSCANGGFCAYHNTATFGSGNIALPYAAMMDTFAGGCSIGCGANATALQNTTSVSAHELAE